jgi:pyruvate dehydrogenase (quinone)
MNQAMKERNKPTIIEAYVDPFEPPMPPKTDPEMIRNMAESFAKGQPYAKRIGLTLYRNQVNVSTTLKSVQNKLKETLTGSKA